MTDTKASREYMGRLLSPEEMIKETAKAMRSDAAGWSPAYRGHYANLFEYAFDRIAELRAENARLRDEEHICRRCGLPVRREWGFDD